VTGLSTTAYCSSYLNGIQSISHSESIIAPLWLDTTNTAVADPEGPTLIPKVRNVTRYSANFIHFHDQNIQHRRHVKEWTYTGGIRGVAPFILNLGARWRWVVNLAPRRLYPWERTTVFIEQEVGCVAEPLRTFCSTENFLPLSGKFIFMITFNYSISEWFPHQNSVYESLPSNASDFFLARKCGTVFQNMSFETTDECVGFSGL